MLIKKEEKNILFYTKLFVLTSIPFGFLRLVWYTCMYSGKNHGNICLFTFNDIKS